MTDEDGAPLTPAENVKLRAMIKDQERATVVWDFFVWLMKTIAMTAAGFTPIVALWKWGLFDIFFRKGGVP